MNVDLREKRTGGTWIRRFGEHETAGFMVSVGNTSAHVSESKLGITFVVERQDIPAAWDEKIDVIKLRAELADAIVRRMSAGVLKELFQEIRSQRQSAFRAGEDAARAEIKEALGL